MTARVFIAHQQIHLSSGRTKFNLAPAKEWGDLVTLLPPEVELKPDVVLPLLRQGLNTFNAERDYIIAIGHPILIAWTGFVLGHHTNRAKFLDWDRELGIYNVVPFSIIEGDQKCLQTAK